MRLHTGQLLLIEPPQDAGSPHEIRKEVEARILGNSKLAVGQGRSSLCEGNVVTVPLWRLP
jgi:hypothetical protein